MSTLRWQKVGPRDHHAADDAEHGGRFNVHRVPGTRRREAYLMHVPKGTSKPVRLALGDDFQNTEAAQRACQEYADARGKKKVDEIRGMKFGHYYVVEVAFAPENPIHRVVACNARDDDTVDLLSGSYEEMHESRVGIKELTHFHVLHEIESMSPEHQARRLPRRKT